MIRPLHLLIHLWWLHFGFTADVLQSPGLIPSRVGDNVTLLCEHQDSSFLYKYWYRQGKDKLLILMGHTHTTQTPNIEKEFLGGKITIQPTTAQKNVLKMLSVSHGDSATYYCA
ncbi:hypothetical protein GDO86_018693, partial [Hymenochirus boettgeri]